MNTAHAEAIRAHAQVRLAAGGMLAAAIADALQPPDARQAGRAVERWHAAVAAIEEATGAQTEEVLYHVANLAYGSARATRHLPRTPFMAAMRRTGDVVVATRSLPGWEDIAALRQKLAAHDGLAYRLAVRHLGEAIEAFAVRTGAPAVVQGVALVMHRARGGGTPTT